MPESSNATHYLYVALRTAAGAYLAICLLAYLFQERFVYFPTTGFLGTPDQQGLKYAVVKIPTADGSELSGWLFEAPQARGYVLYCHGNGGNISHRVEQARLLVDAELTTLLFDYRGYGQSLGKPSEQGTYEDARAAWDHALRELHFDPARTVLWGESLGGGVATLLATEKQAGALVLQSTFTSLADMARERYPILPTRWLLRIHYPSLENLHRVEEPVLVIHSPQDELVPFHQGKELFAAVRGPREMLVISGDHNSGLLDSRAVVEAGLKRFLDTYLDPSRVPSSATPAPASAR